MTEHVVSCIEALDHQAYAHYVLGNLEGALKASNMILALQPGNGTNTRLSRSGCTECNWNTAVTFRFKGIA